MMHRKRRQRPTMPNLGLFRCEPTLVRYLSFLYVVFCVSVLAADETVPLKTGMTAPGSAIAEFVSGPWLEKGTACPVLLHREAVKIAVYVRKLDHRTLPLINAVDGIVAKDSTLKWSFVFVSHENSPTPTSSEFSSQLQTLKELSLDRKLDHVSIGSMIRVTEQQKAVRAKRQLGFFGEDDVVLMLIVPKADKQSVIQYVHSFKSDLLTLEEVEITKGHLLNEIAKSKLP